MTVFAPSPVKPASRPFTSNVGRAQIAFERGVARLAEQFRGAEILPIFLLVERQLRELLALFVTGAARHRRRNSES